MLSVKGKDLYHLSLNLFASTDGVWSKALPLTASCLSPLPRFKSQPEHVRKLPVTFGLGGGFRRILLLPPPVTTG